MSYPRQLSKSVAALLAILSVACGTRDPSARRQAPVQERPPGDHSVRDAVWGSLEGRVPPEEIQIVAECETDAGYRSVAIFGSGVGIRNNETQLPLDRAKVTAALQALDAAGFAGMRESYGGRDDPRVPPEARVLKVTCLVRFAAGPVSKQVVQFEGGRQSPELKRLAHRLLELVAPSARDGVTPASLADGLAKVADGTLAPELLQVTVNRQPEAGADAESWLLRLEGAAIEVAVGPDESDVERYRPGDGEIRKLAGALAENRADALPPNLYADMYTDLIVKVLKHERSIQARRFAEMTPATHGEAQQRFDRIAAALDALRRQVQRAGRRAPH